MENEQNSVKAKLKVVIISDTHNNHSKLLLPKGDILIHCGDFTFYSKDKEITAFVDWLKSTDFKYKIVIAGNHERTLDFNFTKKPSKVKEYLKANCYYLENELLEIEGLKIFGTPLQPIHCNMGFNRNDNERLKSFSIIPSGVDILITHSPPFGILDTIYNGSHVGDKVLLSELDRIRPRFHLFGHIHESNGKEEVNETLFINAAICDLRYSPVNSYHLIEL